MLAKIKQSPWITLAILSSIGLITMHAETMLLPAIPDIIRDFHINYSTSSSILTAYLISGAVMTPIAGKLSDIYGKKKILLIIMIIYTIGVTLGGLAFSISFLFIARIIQGVGLSMFPIAFGIIRSQFPPQKLAVAQGIFISTFAGGSAVCLAVGGPIVNYFGWHATFFSIIPIAVALIVMVDRLIYVSKEEQEPPKSKLDFDYSCVFTKLNQEQLQSQRKDAEQVTIAVISVPPSVTVRAYTPDAKLTPHKEPASLPIMSGKPLYTNYDLSEIKITGLPKATILNPYGGTPYLIAWQTYIGFAMKLSYLASNGYTVLTDAVFSPTIQRIHNNSIILGGSEGITGIMKMNGPITSATSGTIHLEGISDPEPTD